MNAVIMVDSGTAIVDITENDTTTRKYLGEISTSYLNEYSNQLIELGFEVSIIDITAPDE